MNKSILMLFLAILTALLPSCRTITQVEYLKQTDTLYLSSVKYDSIYVHDSLTIREKGDTVWFDRWHTKYVEKLKKDTVIEYRDRDVYVEKETQVKYVPKWMKICTGIGIGLIVIGLVGMVIWLYRKFH